MKAAWYEKQGAARDVLTVGKMDEPQPLTSEVRRTGSSFGEPQAVNNLVNTMSHCREARSHPDGQAIDCVPVSRF
jgi:hypothetical protein